MKDKIYRCRSCGNQFRVKSFMDKVLKNEGRTARCPLCTSTDTIGSVNIMLKKKEKRAVVKHNMDDPATVAQLEYIKNLGGNPGSVKTFGEAGAYIGALKRLHEKK